MNARHVEAMKDGMDSNVFVQLVISKLQEFAGLVMLILSMMARIVFATLASMETETPVPNATNHVENVLVPIKETALLALMLAISIKMDTARRVQDVHQDFINKQQLINASHVPHIVLNVQHSSIVQNVFLDSSRYLLVLKSPIVLKFVVTVKDLKINVMMVTQKMVMDAAVNVNSKKVGNVVWEALLELVLALKWLLSKP